MLRIRSAILLFVALLVAAGTTWLVRARLDAVRAAIPVSAPAEAAEHELQVLVAAANLPAGTFVKPKHLRWQAWPDSNLSPAYLRKGTQSIEAFAGAVVRAGIAAGEPITATRIVRPGERGFLAAVLDPGKRAISVTVNATTGISGFVFPGDRVDLLLTHAIREKGGAADTPRRASETVLSNLRVLAVDQTTDDQSGEAKPPKTATLEVSPKEAEIVSLVAEIGKLSLSLRSLAQEEPAGSGGAVVAAVTDPAAAALGGRSYTWDSEASRLLGQPRSRTVHVVHGSKAEAFALEGAFAGKAGGE
jgi:pilus assembly protein CpaB